MERPLEGEHELRPAGRDCAEVRVREKGSAGSAAGKNRKDGRPSLRFKYMAARLGGRTLVEYQFEVSACFCYIYVEYRVAYEAQNCFKNTHIYEEYRVAYQIH